MDFSFFSFFFLRDARYLEGRTKKEIMGISGGKINNFELRKSWSEDFFFI